MNKWTAWYDSLPDHTKQYLDKQAIWNGMDLTKAFLIGMVVGAFLSMVI
jgi:hypothetical protein